MELQNEEVNAKERVEAQCKAALRKNQTMAAGDGEVAEEEVVVVVVGWC